MTIDVAWTTLIVTLIMATIGLVPTIVIALQAWLKAKTLQIQLDNKPSHADVLTAANFAINRALIQNGFIDDHTKEATDGTIPEH